MCARDKNDTTNENATSRVTHHSCHLIIYAKIASKLDMVRNGSKNQSEISLK